MHLCSSYRRILEDAGWFPGRRISIAHWVKWLTDFGWPQPTGVQLESLEQFGKLRFAMSYGNGGSYPFVVDPERFYSLHPDNIEDVQQEGRKLGESLYPFGSFLVAAPYELFTTPSGRIVMTLDPPSWLFGNDINESLSNLLCHPDKAIEF